MCRDKLTVWEDELRGALSLGDKEMIKRGTMQAGEEEGVEQGDEIKSSCGNGRLHERKEKSN